MQRYAAGAHQRGRDKEGPDQQVRKKQPAKYLAEFVDRAFNKCVACSKLPAGEAFVDDVFQKCAEHCGPQDAIAKQTAGEARGSQVTGTYTGGGD